MPGPRVETVPKARFQVYQKRAINYLRAAESAFADGNLDSAALNAVHSAISASDAVTVFVLGLRSAAQAHLAVVELLARAGAPDRMLDQVRGIVSKKTRVEHEAREVSPAEVGGLMIKARRVLSAAKVVLSQRSEARARSD
jgi:hypothetical protein